MALPPSLEQFPGSFPKRFLYGKQEYFSGNTLRTKRLVWRKIHSSTAWDYTGD